MAASKWPQRPQFFLVFSLFLVLVNYVSAFEVPILDTDYSRQMCSGMWAGKNTYINVTFEPESQGELAMVIYKWSDEQYLGKLQKGDTDEELPFPQRIYVCTDTSEAQGYCSRQQLGQFILDLPEGKSVSDTSFWAATVELSSNHSSGSVNTPKGLRHPSRSNEAVLPRQSTPIPSSGPLLYTEPIHYPVTKTGFYCVAAVPVTLNNKGRRADSDVPFHPSYRGKVLFQNVFKGQLPATDYPKVTFYFVMFLVYAVVAAVWAWCCYRHLHELLPLQYYLSGLVALLVIEMLANWVYYRYLNAHGRGTGATAFLIVVAILDAGRNSMSFFMLLVVALGLSVVRESLERTMLKCQILAGLHFIFGILYGVGIVELELENTSALLLLIFIIPLAFTLSGFLMWIMYALNATIAHLRARKQHYKLKMFERLHYILLSAVVVIAIFFVVSSMSFSGRLAEDYAANTWKTRWWLLDGWLSLLYLTAFVLIIYLWRPSENNSRLLLSEELAQDEADAEDYDLEAMPRRNRGHDDDDDDTATLVGGRGGHGPIGGDDVVFEIGDEDDDEEDAKKRKAANRLSGEIHRGNEERQGLMNNH